MELRVSGLHFQLGYVAGLFQVLSLVLFALFVPWIDHLPFRVAPFCGKSVLNKLFCKLDEMENMFSVSFYYVNICILIVIIEIFYPLSILVC